MNNSVFGKTQENLRNRMRVEVVHHKKIAEKRVANPKFNRSINIRADLTIVQLSISTLLLNKPLYTGFSVLELSKLLMYDFHYN